MQNSLIEFLDRDHSLALRKRRSSFEGLLMVEFKICNSNYENYLLDTDPDGKLVGDMFGVGSVVMSAYLNLNLPQEKQQIPKSPVHHFEP